MVDTRIIYIFLFVEPNKSGPNTIGVPGQGISAIPCDYKKILWKTVKDGLVAIDFGVLRRKYIYMVFSARFTIVLRCA